MITEAPWSRAVIAAGNPATPAPMMTTSAVWSHWMGTAAWALASLAPAPTATAPAAPVVRNDRRLKSWPLMARSPMIVLLWHHLEPARPAVKVVRGACREVLAVGFCRAGLGRPGSRPAAGLRSADRTRLARGGERRGRGHRRRCAARRRCRLGARPHHHAAADVQLLQPGRQLQPAVLFARSHHQDRARHPLPRWLPGRPLCRTLRLT